MIGIGIMAEFVNFCSHPGISVFMSTTRSGDGTSWLPAMAGAWSDLSFSATNRLDCFHNMHSS